MQQAGKHTDKSLRWRCRRGMQELDILLLHYLEHHYAKAGRAEQAAFACLLEQADDVLWDWLSGRGCSDDAGLQAIIARIRQR